MKRKKYIWSSILVFVMICGILSLNFCKKTKVPDPDMFSPAGFYITVSGTANPSTLWVPASEPAVTSIITAVVRDNQGNPLANTKVIFQTDGFGYFENYTLSDVKLTNNMGEAQMVYFVGPGASVKAAGSTFIKLTVPTDGRIDIPILSEVVDWVPIKVIPYLTQGITLGGQIKTRSGNGVEGVVVTFTGEGGSTSGVVVTNPDGYYEFFVAAGWYGAIEPNSDAYSFTPLNYQFDSDNPVYNDRRDLDFVADFEGGQTLAADVTSWDVPVEGGTQEVHVYNSTGDAHIDYTIIPSHSWIQVSRRSGTTPGSFIITIGENKTGAQRSGTIELNATSVQSSSVTIRISQEAHEAHSDARLEVDRQTVDFEYDFDPDDAENYPPIVVNVFNRKTTDSIAYIVTVLEDWIIVNKDSGSTDDTIEIKVETNDTGEPRTGKVTLTVTSTGVSNSQVEITVNQTAGPAVGVNPETYTASAAGGDTFVVNVFDKNNHPDILYWNATNLDSWIYFTPSSGTEDNNIIVTIQTANPTSNPRVGIITITATNGTTATVTITQKGS
ncbi:MAG: hypothetical protein GTO45_28455 [Candidatus Aminicenantes bacterium]|nr:hypothetical protein [Candidatus Aminicenantes bacterium]NIM82729.1 hypothetical protein [Candidatus Aminicenantes bacterium]NIN22106.1 hypothetical protein [Candidatus Aminicenantes bacterium]NIN45865.1 hypothetical protein [Candidatus Aminicenantes bacterium]NIN88702.1 hypothetical protein [Candidatus Aminicenantes bacterium]